MKKTTSVQEAADLIGITRQAVQQAIVRGDLKAELETLGRFKFYRIDLSEVARFKKARESK